MRSQLVVAVVAVGGVLACGGSSSTSADPAAYQALVTTTQGTVSQHRQVAATSDVASCQTERDRYAAQMQQDLQKMQQLSPDMDACMDAMGRGADMASLCGDMQQEMTRHLAQACAGTPADMQQELQRHCDAMDGWLQQSSSQAGQLSGMMGRGGGLMGGGAMGGSMPCGQ